MLVSSYFQYIAATFCIMHISRMNNDLDKITQRVNDNMAFSSLDSLAAIVSPFFAARSGFGTLRIYYSVTWCGSLTVFSRYRLFGSSITVPQIPYCSNAPVMTINRLPWWEIVRQHSPLCTSFTDVKGSVNDGMLFVRGSHATIVRRLKIAFDKRALF
uniref:Uncharacterized protein n=1 Tax=Candidatus Kentrum sp. TC TaxID=2126339 RepID=A0A450YXC8_9GAMM|nr:MAG: hypothetical protein BECKTC1821E_GA0114239_106011 [Candidatus Kentron sp. TC]